MPYKTKAPANSTASHSVRVAAARTKAARKASASLPTCNVDWRRPALNRLRKSVITPVKDQGQCGAELTPTHSRCLGPIYLLKPPLLFERVVHRVVFICLGSSRVYL